MVRWMVDSKLEERRRKGLPGGLLHMWDFRGRTIPRPEEQDEGEE